MRCRACDTIIEEGQDCPYCAFIRTGKKLYQSNLPAEYENELWGLIKTWLMIVGSFVIALLIVGASGGIALPVIIGFGIYYFISKIHYE